MLAEGHPIIPKWEDIYDVFPTRNTDLRCSATIAAIDDVTKATQVIWYPHVFSL